MKMIVSFALLLIVLLAGMMVLQTANYQTQYRETVMDLHLKAGVIVNETTDLLSTISQTLRGRDTELHLPTGFIDVTGIETRNGMMMDFRNGAFLHENSSAMTITYERYTPFGKGLMFAKASSVGYHYVFIPDQYWRRYEDPEISIAIQSNGRTIMGEISRGLVVERPIPNYPLTVTVSVREATIVMAFITKQAPVLGMMLFAITIYGVILHQFIRQYNALSLAIQEAEVANIAKTQIIANTSHELRTLLNSVIGFSDLMLTGQLTDRHRRYITAINTSGKELLSLIDDILGFAKMEEGKFVLDEKEFLLEAPVLSMVEVFYKMAVNQHISFADDIACPKKMIGDEKRVLQVIQYMGKFAIQNSKHHAGMEIKDENGLLIRFYTDDRLADGKLKNAHIPFAHAGNILTLPLVYRLVELHGGTVETRPLSTYPHGMETLIAFPSWRTEDASME